MTKKLCTLAAAFGLASLLGASPALQAQQPALDGPLRIVVAYSPGGVSDKVARIVGDKLTRKLGVSVVVENKTGAGGRLAAQQVKGTPTGQNILMLATPAMMVVAPLVFKDNGYDADKDFVPVSHVNDYEFTMSVSTAVPVTDVSQLVAWVRANPDKATFGVPATGSLPHFFALMTAEKAGVKGAVVGYRGSGPLLTDLIGDQVPIAFDTLDAALQAHEGAKIRILATSGGKRSEFAPKIPTFKEAGLDLVATGWNVFYAPKSMPVEKVALLSEAIQEVMKDPETVKRFHDATMSAVVSTQAQTVAMLKSYREQWAPVVRKSGYQP